MKALHGVKKEVIELRKIGLSIKEIVKKTHRPQSTISGWVKNIPLTEEQRKYLDSKDPSKNHLRSPSSVERSKITWMERRKKFQEEGRQLSINNNVNFIAGLMLYWAEGAKTRNRNTVCLSNTDVHLMKFFTNFLRHFFDVKEEEISIRINCWLNNGLTLDEIEKYWIDQLGLNKSNIRKSYIEQKRLTTGKKKNIHLYGVCAVKVNRTDIIQKIYGAIQEFVGFSRPEWVA